MGCQSPNGNITAKNNKVCTAKDLNLNSFEIINFIITVTATTTAIKAAETLVIIASPIKKPHKTADFTEGELYHFKRYKKPDIDNIIVNTSLLMLPDNIKNVGWKLSKTAHNNKVFPFILHCLQIIKPIGIKSEE